jgi:hypothetical protein
MRRRQSVFDSLVDNDEAVPGGFLLLKKPPGIARSVKSRIENAVASALSLKNADQRCGPVHNSLSPRNQSFGCRGVESILRSKVCALRRFGCFWF